MLRGKIKSGESGRKVNKRFTLPNSTYIFVILFLIFSIVVPNFFTAENLSIMLQQACILIVLSVAMAVSIMADCINLSVGGIVSFAGVIIALLINAGVPGVWAILLGVVVSMIFGLITGIIAVKMRIGPFIATFAMMGVAQALANTLSGKRAIYLEKDIGAIRFLQSDLIKIRISQDQIFAVSNMLLLAIAVIAVVVVLFQKTPLGANVYALGNNPEIAKLSRINVDGWSIWIYVLTSAVAGIAAIFMLLRLNSAQPTAGDGLEFQAVVAAVLGGNALEGGKGSIAGSIIGALVVFIVRSGLSLAGYNGNLVMVVLGSVLIAGVVLNELASKGFGRDVRRYEK